MILWQAAMSYLIQGGRKRIRPNEFLNGLSPFLSPLRIGRWAATRRTAAAGRHEFSRTAGQGTHLSISANGPSQKLERSLLLLSLLHTIAFIHDEAQQPLGASDWICLLPLPLHRYSPSNKDYDSHNSPSVTADCWSSTIFLGCINQSPPFGASFWVTVLF